MGEMYSSSDPSIIHFNSKHLLQIFSLLILVLSPISSLAATVVRSLPGYPGDLPFRLETGYIGAGKEEQVQLFYHFIESERDPKTDPLLLWFSGGPGCSSLTALFLEIGPLKFNYSPASWDSEVPKLELNPYSWTKVANIIFVDSPVGAGFSYATTSEGYYSDDITASKDSYEFLKKWLLKHAEFQKNPLYIAGDSYTGIPIPILVQEIVNGNKAGTGQLMNLKGYILGNPVTEDSTNSKFEFAHRVSLLSDELYEATRVCSHGNYETGDARKSWCQKMLQAVSNALNPLFVAHILEPSCNTSIPPKWCRDREDLIMAKWANNLKVQEALHIREGTKIQWARCNRTIPGYTKNGKSSFDYHLNFTKELFHALIYSGDQDLMIPYVGTVAWIEKLNLSIVDRWRPWFTKGQVAGYTTKYSNGHYHLTFATVKGAGHMAPEYKPRECLQMITKWLKMHPL